MNQILTIAARWLHGVSVALWLGGLIAIGALVAPTAFHVMTAHSSDLSNPESAKALAGAVVGGSLRVFNIVCYVCGALMLVSNLVLLTFQKEKMSRLLIGLDSALTVALLAMTAYLGFQIFPSLDLAQAHHNTALFDHLHHLYEQVSMFQLPWLLVIALCVAVRDSQQTVGLR